jgi:uncharacterized protein YbbC (DUF1343 family)
MKKKFRITAILPFLLLLCFGIFNPGRILAQEVRVGAMQLSRYLPLIGEKKIAVVANPGSVCGSIHLVDTLLSSGVKVLSVFAPEHGFRGEAEAGEIVKDGRDTRTGVRVISLYGDHKKPMGNDLDSIETVVFDLQDVGVRFYTYISTLQYVMEACARKSIPVIVLDRPNPHGHYIDGPVLEDKHRSFVGLQPVPVIYGMTIGEYARMLNGERWLEDGLQCQLTVIQLEGWKRGADYTIPIPPSPNLPNMKAVMLYPSLCFFEGTNVSLGRGTLMPFQVYGFPENPAGDFEFTPQSIPGKAKVPLYEGRVCRGRDLRSWKDMNRVDRLHLEWLIDAWKHYPEKTRFFNAFFEKLSGTDELRKQIQADMTEEKIRASWKPGLDAFAKIRKKYLLYP